MKQIKTTLKGRWYKNAIYEGVVLSCHDRSDGGLGVALESHLNIN